MYITHLVWEGIKQLRCSIMYFKLFPFLSSPCVQRGCSTYHNTFNNGLHSYISVIARNLIKKHLSRKNLPFKQFPFVLRYLCNMREPLHNCTFLLSTCNNANKSVNINNLIVSQIVITRPQWLQLKCHQGQKSSLDTGEKASDKTLQFRFSKLN